MKHAVVVAHPNPKSLTAAVGAAYAAAALKLRDEVVVRDLYRMGFDPCLKATEIPGAPGYAAGADVRAEREILADVDVFAFVYPFWFNAPPAILKGYMDRVFSLGFGFAPAFGGTSPQLKGRKLISFSLSGAPDAWVRDTGALRTLTGLLDSHLAAVCGLTVVDHVHFGGIVPGITEEAAQDVLGTVRETVERRFASPDLRRTT